MIRKSALLMALIGGVIVPTANRAEAQGFGVNPPLSPWLYLNQKQPGPVDNYHMYVLPQQQLQSTLQSQQGYSAQRGHVRRHRPASDDSATGIQCTRLANGYRGIIYDPRSVV
jgi:hypothetical protein